LATILTFGSSDSVGATMSVTGSSSSTSAGTSQLAVLASRNATPIPTVPTRTPMWDGDGSAAGTQTVAQLGNLNRTWYYFFQRRLSGGGAGFEWRTLLIKNTAVGTNVADVVPVMTLPAGGTANCQEVIGVLRKAIAADLTVRLNLWVSGASSLVGAFTIPASTGINAPIAFPSSGMTTTAFPDLSALTWDVIASDGSSDSGGVASFTVLWQ
jgi:hypothetical protein